MLRETVRQRKAETESEEPGTVEEQVCRWDRCDFQRTRVCRRHHSRGGARGRRICMTPRGHGTFEQSVGVGLRRHLGLVHVLSEMSHLT